MDRNQPNVANRYVENSFKKGLFTEMVNGYSSVLREQVLGVTKLDFLDENTYIELKTPLQSI
ncbi:hypothetical protein [Methanobacterium sp.]|uniref:hypothetical protein n=1 Tax=Methanobacterium sp. TaxID=2164 RepID=UPI003C77BA8E